MESRERCICQNQSHGHAPSKCPNRGTEADDLCKDCHERSGKNLRSQRGKMSSSHVDVGVPNHD